MSDVRYTRDEVEDLMREAITDAVAGIRDHAKQLTHETPYSFAFLAIFDEAVKRQASE